MNNQQKKHKMVSLDKVCEYLKGLTYQEYPGGPMERMISDEFIKINQEKFYIFSVKYELV